MSSFVISTNLTNHSLRAVLFVCSLTSETKIKESGGAVVKTTAKLQVFSAYPLSCYEYNMYIAWKKHCATLKQLSEAISAMENKCNYASGRKLLFRLCCQSHSVSLRFELLHMSDSQELPQKHVYTNYDHAWLTVIKTLTLTWYSLDKIDKFKSREMPPSKIKRRTYRAFSADKVDLSILKRNERDTQTHT